MNVGGNYANNQMISEWKNQQFGKQKLSFIEIFTQLTLSIYPDTLEVYSIQHYVIKFVRDLRQVGGYLWVLLLPPPIKLTATM
jgi:hypothetical protein